MRKSFEDIKFVQPNKTKSAASLATNKWLIANSSEPKGFFKTFTLSLIFIFSYLLVPAQKLDFVLSQGADDEFPREIQEYLGETETELYVFEQRAFQKGIKHIPHPVVRVFNKHTMETTKTLFLDDLNTKWLDRSAWYVGCALLNGRIGAVYFDNENRAYRIKWYNEELNEVMNDEVVFEIGDQPINYFNCLITSSKDNSYMSIVVLERLGEAQTKMHIKSYNGHWTPIISANRSVNANILHASAYTNIFQTNTGNLHIVLVMKSKNLATEQTIKAGRNIITYKTTGEEEIHHFDGKNALSALTTYELYGNYLYYAYYNNTRKNKGFYTGAIDLSDYSEKSGFSKLPPEIHALNKSIDKHEKYLDKAKAGKDLIDYRTDYMGMSVTQNGQIVTTLAWQDDEDAKWGKRYKFRNVIICCLKPEGGEMLWSKIIERRYGMLQGTTFMPPYYLPLAKAVGNDVFFVMNTSYEGMKTLDLRKGDEGSSVTQLIHIQPNGSWTAYPMIHENQESYEHKPIANEIYVSNEGALIMPFHRVSYKYLKIYLKK
jgi:hypothetical protein